MAAVLTRATIRPHPTAEPHPSDRLGRDGSDPDGRSSRLWWTLASMTLTWTLLAGFGAFNILYPISPTVYTGITGALLLVTVLMSPRGRLGAVRFVRPMMLLVGWILLSYLWSSYRGEFVKETGRDLITVFAVVIVGQLLPIDRFLRVVLRAGYCAIALIGVTLALMPGRAYSVADGLHGGFIHKSAMGSTLMVLVAAAFALERRTWVRRAVPIGVLILMVLGRSTTGIASFLMVACLYGVLLRYPMIRQNLGRSFRVFAGAAVVVFGAFYFAASQALVALSGKDLTFSKRTLIWQGVMDAVRQRPFVGYGWPVWTALWKPPASSIIATAGFVIAESHNAALELLLRLGIIGLGLYLVLLFTALRTGIRLVADGDRAGIFTVLLVATIVIWGFSEALPVSGVWVGLLGVVAVARPLAGTETGNHPESASRLFAPKAADVH